jgi:hypothetical protein
MSRPLFGAFLLSVCVGAACAAEGQKTTAQQNRVGNWYYISGSDGMFGVPRLVAAVHDTRARTSLVFTCQGRPGATAGAGEMPMMSLKLTEPIGSRGATTRVRMRLDDEQAFRTRWTTSAEGESALLESSQIDPLQLLFRMAGKKHRLLNVETSRKRLQFDLQGATPVLLEMLDRCVKPAAAPQTKTRQAEAKTRKRGK